MVEERRGRWDGQMGEGEWELQASISEMDKSEGGNAQHREYNQ